VMREPGRDAGPETGTFMIAKDLLLQGLVGD